MRRLLAVSLGLLLATTAFAKTEPQPRVNVPVARQGGDTVADAFVVPGLPFAEAGITTGYTDDYDEACPSDGSVSPDVVYAYTPTYDGGISVDLCGSSYDTKVYVYDQDLVLVACNDDYYFGGDCGVYVSKLEHVDVDGGETYAIVIDGYGGDFGDYLLAIQDAGSGCVLVCPDGSVDEGEPPMQNDAPLSFNCGCQCADPSLISVLAGDADGHLIHCARNGWFALDGSIRRDDDYLSALVGNDGAIYIKVDAEFPLYLFQMTTDCSNLTTIQWVSCGPCSPATMDVVGAPGELVWLFAAAVAFEPPAGETPYEFDYAMSISGLMAAVASENASWGTIKSLFR